MSDGQGTPPARSQEGPDCRWVAWTYPAWGSEAHSLAGGWKTVKAGSETAYYKLQGPCPRCLHEDGIDRTHTPILDVATKVAPKRHVFIECTCSGTHKPKEGKGCGQAGDVPFGVSDA